MSLRALWRRLVQGERATWLSDRYRAALPADLATRVMTMAATDRYHAKQGRSTARVDLPAPGGSLSVYLKRHYRLPWPARLHATLDPAGRHTPASAEWANLERARDLGIAVPDAVAGGEWIGPWGSLQSFLMVAELTGQEALNEALPGLQAKLDRASFAHLKRMLIAEMAEMTARLHQALLFHKDLYLCHFFINLNHNARAGRLVTLIDLHRLARHRLLALRWRHKDLAQLLFSTYDVPGVSDRDRLRFWSLYRRSMRMAWPRLEAKLVALKAARYRAHNR